MPHECTNCGRTFDDGSTEMLSGCPTCGGRKFQFRPEGEADRSTDDAAVPSDDAPDRSGPPDRTGEGLPTDDDPLADDTRRDDPHEDGPRTADDAGSTDIETGTEAAGDTEAEGVEESTGSVKTPEDTAQASARSDVVTAAELDGAAETTADSDPDPEPDVETLREELNEQFESIRILNPGQYELNLMELYDRQEYIISLREDGRYVIEMPEEWGPRDDE